MKKRGMLFFSLAMAVCLSSRSVPINAQDGWYNPPYAIFGSFGTLSTPNALGGAREVFGALLYTFYIAFTATAYKEQAVGSVEKLVFQFPVLKGFDRHSVRELRLVWDANENKRHDAGDTVVARGTIDFTARTLTFLLHDTLVAPKWRYYLLEGDFQDISDGMEMRITFSPDLVVREEGNEKNLPLLGSPDVILHHQGNLRPDIRFSYFPAGGNGVAPQMGRMGEMFEFGVMYFDEDGERAPLVEVWIDLDSDGHFSAKERFPLESAEPNNTNYASRRGYIIRKQIVPVSPGKVKYRFWANDGKDDAGGDATAEHEIIVNGAVLVGAPHVSLSSIVPGERFEVRYPVLTFFKDVSIRWDVLQDQFLPFLVKSVVRKDSAPVDFNYDEESLVLTLEVPRAMPFGIARTAPFTLPFTLKNSEKQGEWARGVIVPSFALPVTPLRVSTMFSPSRTPLTIGDALGITLTVIKRRDIVLVNRPEQEIDFSPLTIEGSPLVARKLRDDLEEVTYHFNLRVLIAGAPSGKGYQFVPYSLEYQLPGEKKIRRQSIPLPYIWIAPILDAAALRAAPPVRPRPFAFRDGIALLVGERVIFSALGVLMLAGAFIMAGYRPVRYAVEMIRLSPWFLAREAYGDWRRVFREFQRAQPKERALLFSELERTFRSAVGLMAGFSVEESQSVLFDERVGACEKFPEALRRKILDHLCAFRSMGDASFDEDGFLLSDRALQKEVARYR